jgi:hypothetical protein
MEKYLSEFTNTSVRSIFSIYVKTFKYTLNKILFMSKSKLIIGIILLVTGGGLIPTGFFVNQMFVDQIADGVPEALLAVEEEALPSLEEQLPPLATPDVLLGVEDAAVTSLEEQLPILGTPDVLLGIEEEALVSLEGQLPVLATPAILDALKGEAIAALPAIINGSGAAKAINGTIDYVGLVIGIGHTAAKGEFFNSSTFQADFLTMQGVSDYYDTLMGNFDMVNLGYTVTAQNNLLYGVGPLPGLITDLDLGMGVLGYMELYLNVTLGDQTLNATMQLYYNATWSQLEALAGYIKNYLWDVVVKGEYSPATIEQVAELMFYEQWANGTVVEGGLDLSLFKDTLPEGTFGLEAGVPDPTNITYFICIDLWDVSNSSAFVNDTGILKWVGAMQGDGALQIELMGVFSLTPLQLPILLGWLGNFMTNLVPLLLLDETGYTVPQLAQLAFYEQWSSGTIQGQSILPDGFLNEISAAFAGAPYFEVGLPSPSGLSPTETENLWNEASAYTFVNTTGILLWVGAMQGDEILQGNLTVAFGISAGELAVLLNWLGNFLTVRVPQLIEYETGYTIPELAQLGFYEQWANGTIQGQSILPDGFLGELNVSYAGAPYFEVGLPNPSNLSLSDTMSLWNKTNAYTFVNMDGILVWLGAITNTSLQSVLLTKFNISAGELTILLAWLGAFLTVRVPQLVEYNTGYTIPELAQVSFYEQWADGTIQGLSILPDGFLSELDPPLLGPPYFEVGLTEGATGLSASQCDALWDETSEYSLVNASGISKWYKAKSSQTTYDDLRVYNDFLSHAQMTQILDWLPQFRDEIVNALAKEQLGLPMEPYALGTAIFAGLGAGGGTLAAVGIVLLILSKRK